MINWKVRFKNVHFVLPLLVSVVFTVLAYQDLTATDITSWATLWKVIVDFVSNPYLVISVLAQIYQATIDPTTGGVTDSKQALSYNKPKK